MCANPYSAPTTRSIFLHLHCVCVHMYQDANTSAEGGQHEIHENEDSIMVGNEHSR